MERDEIVVIYYYAPNTTVTVKYLEKDNTPNDNSDNKVLAPEEIINGYVGNEYTTQAQNVEGYTLVETTNNTEGTMTKDEIEYLLSADTSSYLIDKMDLCSYVRPQPATMINMPQSAINAPVQS